MSETTNISTINTVHTNIEPKAVNQPVEPAYYHGQKTGEKQSFLEPIDKDLELTTDEEFAEKVRGELGDIDKKDPEDKEDEDVVSKTESEEEKPNELVEAEANKSEPEEKPQAKKEKKKKNTLENLGKFIIDLAKQLLKILLVIFAFFKLWMFGSKNPFTDKYSGKDLDLSKNPVQGRDNENLAVKLRINGTTWDQAVNRIENVKDVDFTTLEDIVMREVNNTLPAIKLDDRDQFEKHNNKQMFRPKDLARNRTPAFAR